MAKWRKRVVFQRYESGVRLTSVNEARHWRRLREGETKIASAPISYRRGSEHQRNFLESRSDIQHDRLEMASTL